jgi:hypothetical protein
MTRAAHYPIVFTVLLSLAAPVFAQDAAVSAPDAAVKEAVRRQARTVELRQKLIEAGQTQENGENNRVVGGSGHEISWLGVG